MNFDPLCWDVVYCNRIGDCLLRVIVNTWIFRELSRYIIMRIRNIMQSHIINVSVLNI